MSDMNRFWDSISKLGEQLGQLGMYNYQNKQEEERASRARKEESDLRAKETARETAMRSFAEKELVRLRSDEAIRVSDAERLKDAQAEAFFGDADLASEAMQAYATQDPVAITRLEGIFDGVRRIQRGEDITPEHQQLFNTLGFKAGGKVAELQGAAMKFKKEMTMAEMNSKYIDAQIKRLEMEGKPTINHLLGLQKERNDLQIEFNKIKQNPSYVLGLDAINHGKKISDAQMATFQGLQENMGFLAEQIKINDKTTGIISKMLDIDVSASPDEPPPPGEDKAAPEVAGQKKKGFFGNIASQTSDLPDLVRAATDNPGAISLDAVRGVAGGLQKTLQQAMPMSPKIPKEIDEKLHKKYKLPPSSVIHYSEGGEVLTKQADGKHIVTKRDDLKLVARPDDYLFDAGTGKMYKLDLMLGEVPGSTEALDAEDEIFPE